jgi:hypothetical protein
MSDTRYNGWTNYETWVVNLWMDNEEGTHDYWLEVAEDVYHNEAEEQKHFSKMEDAVCILADRLKDDHEDRKCNILENAELTSSVWADLLGATLSEVNWNEIAEHLLENIEVEA